MGTYMLSLKTGRPAIRVVVAIPVNDAHAASTLEIWGLQQSRGYVQLPNSILAKTTKCHVLLTSTP